MRYSEEFNKIVGYAREEALRTGCGRIGTDHLVLGILRHADNNACMALKALGVNLDEMKRCIESPLFNDKGLPYSAVEDMELSIKARETIATAAYEARSCGAAETLGAHLLLAASNSDGSAIQTYLNSLGISHRILEEKMKKENFLGIPHKGRTPRKLTFVIPVGGGKVTS